MRGAGVQDAANVLAVPIEGLTGILVPLYGDI